ncbi:MAG: HAD-IC family P-type ATPase, partial [Methyloceanibacter sp.]
TGIEAAPGFEPDEVLRVAAALEAGSEHPLAEAILRGADARGLQVAKTERFESVTGAGVKASVGGSAALLGNARMMETARIDVAPLAHPADARREQGETVMFLGLDGTLAGFVAVADPVKPSSAEAIAKLHALGLKIVMATGDNATTARAVAAKLRIDEVAAGLSPADKLGLIDDLQRKGATVAMAGDGINDAPALARADVGVAMGTGADVAMESAGLTLLKGDLRGVVRGVKLARATLRNIKQNLLFAFAYNVLGVPIAAGVLYPFAGITLSPMIAAAAMSLSSVSVVGNALRLRSINLD